MNFYDMTLDMKNMSQLLIERICKDYNMESEKESMLRRYIFNSYTDAVEDVVAEEYCGDEIDFSKLPEEIPEIIFTEPEEEVVEEEEEEFVIEEDEEEEVVAVEEVEEEEFDGLFSGDDDEPEVVVEEVVEEPVSKSTPLPPTLSKSPIQSPEASPEPVVVEEPVVVDYSKMSVKQLKALCKTAGLKKYSKMKKNQLIEALSSQ